MSETHHRAARPTDLGALRTVMAADRTLMAWIRTALSMFSFGFTIYKVLDTMAESGAIADSAAPRQIGMFLAVLGTVSMLFGTIGYWATLREMQMSEQFRIGRPVLIMALIMIVTGLGLIVGIAGRFV
ncbi:YidH family protein [Sandaracinobacteroides hominis]|uniref:YidH family protein n=1 Tax=Sandaracinobacteroides hominis TaxID=2780086 RepID=UPI0018F40AA4|nr:DUF202 domain-containing protein [Sandaracinobacteroides hominis]